MSDYNNQQQQRPKTVLNHRALSLYAPNGEGKFANLSFDIKKNEVLVTVRTNIAADANNDYGRLQAQIEPTLFNTFLAMLEHAATTTEEFRWAIEFRDKKFIGQGKMTDGPVLHWRMVVGRDEAGIVFISVVLDKRPNIKFSFLNNTKTTFKDGNGNEMPKDLESKFLTLGKIATIRDYVPIILKELYKHPEPKQQGGGYNRGGQGGGGGNYNRGGQGGGGGNYAGGGAAAGGGGAAVDMGGDDIPW